MGQSEMLLVSDCLCVSPDTAAWVLYVSSGIAAGMLFMCPLQVFHDFQFRMVNQIQNHVVLVS